MRQKSIKLQFDLIKKRKYNNRQENLTNISFFNVNQFYISVKAYQKNWFSKILLFSFINEQEMSQNGFDDF